MTDICTDWQPIDTAPRAWIREPTFDLDGRKVTIRNGTAIKVRGMTNGLECEGVAYWAQHEGFAPDTDPHWWDPVHEEPLGFAPTEWRELAPGEIEIVAPDLRAQAPETPASTPPPPSLPPEDEQAAMKTQAFMWLLNAHGGRPLVWAEAWGRLLWLSGKPDGADPNGTLSADLGDGHTLEQDLALDWELNRASYTNLAGAIIRDLAKAAGFTMKGNPA